MLCAIYVRLSKEDEEKQGESESIQNQKSLLTHYAADHGWDVYAVYCDEDYSGADRLRPDFNRMIDAARQKKFQIVLCKTQSRFTRDMELVEKYIHGLFLVWGIRFVAVADHVDTEIRGNKKARQINGLINEWYLEDLSESIRVVFDLKRKEGKYIGGCPLYGYQKDPSDKNKIIIDPEAARVVRQIFQWSLEGVGKQRIAALLNNSGAMSPAQYKKERGQNAKCCEKKDFSLWNKTTVWRILRNEMYTGVMVQGRTKRSAISRKLSFPCRKNSGTGSKVHMKQLLTQKPFRRSSTVCNLGAGQMGQGSSPAGWPCQMYGLRQYDEQDNKCEKWETISIISSLWALR